MQVRRQARIAALQALFEIDVVHHTIEVVLDRRMDELGLPTEGCTFAQHIVQGVLDNQEQLEKRFAGIFIIAINEIVPDCISKNPSISTI